MCGLISGEMPPFLPERLISKCLEMCKLIPSSSGFGNHLANISTKFFSGSLSKIDLVLETSSAEDICQSLPGTAFSAPSSVKKRWIISSWNAVLLGTVGVYLA
jgi:hypothetical protein